jgi:hypothetical protein
MTFREPKPCVASSICDMSQRLFSFGVHGWRHKTMSGPPPPPLGGPSQYHGQAQYNEFLQQQAPQQQLAGAAAAYGRTALQQQQQQLQQQQQQLQQQQQQLHQQQQLQQLLDQQQLQQGFRGAATSLPQPHLYMSQQQPNVMTTTANSAFGPPQPSQSPQLQQAPGVVSSSSQPPAATLSPPPPTVSQQPTPPTADPAVKALPIRAYLDQTVVPILLDGTCCIKRIFCAGR